MEPGRNVDVVAVEPVAIADIDVTVLVALAVVIVRSVDGPAILRQADDIAVGVAREPAGLQRFDDVFSLACHSVVVIVGVALAGRGYVVVHEACVLRMREATVNHLDAVRSVRAPAVFSGVERVSKLGRQAIEHSNATRCQAPGGVNGVTVVGEVNARGHKVILGAHQVADKFIKVSLSLDERVQKV